MKASISSSADPPANRRRTGKIARLPLAVRQQLNQKLQDGSPGEPLLHWLNSLPEVQAALAAQFGGQPIGRQNLSAWRHGGFLEWQGQQRPPMNPSPKNSLLSLALSSTSVWRRGG